MTGILFTIGGFCLGALILWLFMRISYADMIAKLKNSEHNLQAANELIAELRADLQSKVIEVAKLTAMLSHEKQVGAEQRNFVEKAQEQLSAKFNSIASQVLRQNSEGFMELAKNQLSLAEEKAKTSLQKGQSVISELVNPIKDALQRLEKHNETIEKGRIDAYAELRSQISSLHGEASKLSRALSNSKARGNWGELQLRRVIEISGMQEHCDFYQQQSSETEGGKLQRPDMVIRLCSGRTIVVDAKAPFEAYMEMIEATDDASRKKALERHAKLVGAQVDALGKKEYWKQFDPSPDFVVLFLPGENFFSAALEVEPSLIETAWQKKILLATPTTLIALLRSAAHGWKEEQLAENAKEISERSAELYNRLCKFTDFLSGIGHGLEKAIDNYNSAVRSFETRLLPQAKRCYEKHSEAKMKEIEELELINTVPQKPTLAAIEHEVAVNDSL